MVKEWARLKGKRVIARLRRGSAARLGARLHPRRVKRAVKAKVAEHWERIGGRWRHVPEHS